MGLTGRVAATVALTLTAMLIGVAVSSTVASPSAQACEKHESPSCDHTPAPLPVTSLRIAGTLIRDPLSTAPTTYTVDARLVNGQATGTASVQERDGFTTSGPVLQVVPPGRDRDYFCVNFENSSNVSVNRVVIYFRDNGDGVLTHDEVVHRPKDGVDCAAVPDDGALTLTPADAGNFAVSSP